MHTYKNNRFAAQFRYMPTGWQFAYSLLLPSSSFFGQWKMVLYPEVNTEHIICQAVILKTHKGHYEG